MTKQNPSTFIRWTTWVLVGLISFTPFISTLAANVNMGAGTLTPEGGLTVTTIYTNIIGHPSADVPGMPGVHFGPGTGTTHFDRPFGSPNGNWILSADTDLPTAEDEIILINDVVKAREGTIATWTIGENIGLIDTKLGINDNGEWVFATNTDGPTTADDYVVFVSSTDIFSAVAKEGDPIPALPAATWDDLLDSAVIAADGTVGLSADGIDGVPTTEDDILVLGNTLLAQEGVTIPSNQLGSEFWENFDINDYWINSDGSHWLVQGDLTGDTTSDNIVAVDGAVVVQEGVVLPGTGFAEPVDSLGIAGVHMTPNGDWYVRGNNDVTEQDWVYSNRGLVAFVGGPIFPGTSEVYSDADFSDCFFLQVGDSNGNYVIGGVTNNPSTNNGVLVANSSTVIVREGDQLDLDNNGTPDDAYFNTFGNDDGYLSDAGIFYFTATIKDGTDTVIGQGFFSVDISSVLAAPGIAVAPSSLSSAQPPNTVITQTLTISNTGGTFLDWTIFESQTALQLDNIQAGGSCAVPGDIPWATISPSSGNTLAGYSSNVDVAFDSAGLAPGIVYSGTLCVSSNDGLNPLVSVPISLTVEVVYGVDLSGDQAASALPGETVTYTLSVTNTGNTTDTFDISVIGDWTATQSDTSVTLTPGATTSFEVAVTVPPGAFDGANDVATVTATSQAEPTATDSASLTTTVGAVYGVDLSGDQSASAGANTMVSYILSITNTGNTTDTFDLSATGIWTATLSDAAITVGAGESITFTVSVEIPSNAANGDFDTTSVTATSQSDGSVTDSAVLTTIANVETEGYKIYLPVIFKGQ